MRLLAQLFVYSCVATMLSLALGLGVLWSSGKVTGEKLFQVLAVIHDVDLDTVGEDPEAGGEETSPEQPSFDDMEQQRAAQSRNLELKMQALSKGLEDLHFKRNQLNADKKNHEDVRASFEERLMDLNGETSREGFANVRLIWESIKPKLARDQIMAMVEDGEIDDVVKILADMPNNKQAKIVSTFTSPEEVEAMNEVLRMIRKGFPKKQLIDSTLELTQSAKPTSP